MLFIPGNFLVGNNNPIDGAPKGCAGRIVPRFSVGRKRPCNPVRSLWKQIAAYRKNTSGSEGLRSENKQGEFSHFLFESENLGFEFAQQAIHKNCARIGGEGKKSSRRSEGRTKLHKIVGK